MNSSILQSNDNGSVSVRERASEYAPIVLASRGNEQYRFYDLAFRPTVNASIRLSRDTGIAAMSQPKYMHIAGYQPGEILLNKSGWT